MMRLLIQPVPAILVLLLYMWQWGVVRSPEWQVFIPQWWWLGSFFWCMYRPQCWPVSVQLVVGVWLDLMMGMPLGVTALLSLLGGLVVQRRMRILQEASMLGRWINFAVWFAAIWSVLWLVSTLYTRQHADATWLLVQGGITVLVFPLWSMLMERLNDWMERVEG